MTRLAPSLLAALLLAFAAAPAAAVNPNEMLKDPALEGRAHAIGKGLRCLVCQNESIEDSNAELAGDLRVLVRERLAAGDSDNQVVDYIVSRYGDFVLLKPPVKMGTLVLWAGPAVIMVLGVVFLVTFFRRRQAPGAATPATGPAALSDDERRRLAALLEDDKP